MLKTNKFTVPKTRGKVHAAQLEMIVRAWSSLLTFLVGKNVTVVDS